MPYIGVAEIVALGADTFVVVLMEADISPPKDSAHLDIRRLPSSFSAANCNASAHTFFSNAAVASYSEKPPSS